MKFEERRFSKRFPPINCAIVVVHQLHIQGRIRGTGAALILEDGRIWIGTAMCAAGDPFVKSKGRQKAIGRAYQRARTGSLGTANFYAPGTVSAIGAIVSAIKVELSHKRLRLEER